MNALGDLVRQRVAELQAEGQSIRSMGQRAGSENPNHLRYYLQRTEPSRRVIAPQVVEHLAVALDLPWKTIWRAGILSMLPEHPTPLQRLLREAQADLELDSGVLAERAGLNRTYLQRIFDGDYGVLRPETVRGLSVAFKVPQKTIREAAKHTTVEYRLPANLASRMTPEKWVEVLRVVEVMVSG